MRETVEARLGSEPYNFAWGKFRQLETKSYGTAVCPDHARFLDNVEYHPSSGWLIPRGVSVTQSRDDGLSSVTMTLRFAVTEKGVRPIGITSGLVTNRSWYNTVYLYLHCTNNPDA